MPRKKKTGVRISKRKAKTMRRELHIIDSNIAKVLKNKHCLTMEDVKLLHINKNRIQGLLSELASYSRHSETD